MYPKDEDRPDPLQQPRQGNRGRAARTAGGAVVGAAALGAKFFALLKGLFVLKFLVFIPKLLSFGALFEGRRWAMPLEGGRIAAVAAVAVWVIARHA